MTVFSGYEVKIMASPAPNPRREQDNLSTMVCFHRRYNLGDNDHGLSIKDRSSWQAWQRWLENMEAVWRPLYLYDHSGLSIATSRQPTWWHADWDMMTVGFIYVTEEMLKRAGWELPNGLTSEERSRVLAVLDAEVEEYDRYLRGEDLYSYEVYDPNGELVWESYGFDSEEGALDEAKEVAANLLGGRRWRQVEQ